MARQKFRILLADSNELGNLLLTASLQSVPSIEIVGEAVSGQAAIDMARQYEPDAIVTESFGHVTGGSDAFRIIRLESPKVEIIELASFDNPASQKQISKDRAGSDCANRKIVDVVLAAVFPCTAA
jgi:DNA-binding NarL/FixJ family response regulator